MTDPTRKPAPQSGAVTDEQLVRALVPITMAFCWALAIIGAVGVLFIVPDPTVTLVGVALGVVLGLVSWFVPGLLIRGALSRAAGSATDPASDLAVHGAVRTAVFIGLAAAEVPALLALVLAVADGHDVGALVIAVPVAIVSLVVNVSGPTAVRRHLARLRDPAAG